MNPGIPLLRVFDSAKMARFNEAGAMNPGIRKEEVNKDAILAASMRPGL